MRSSESETRPGALKTLLDIPKAIREGQVAPLYFFYGNDSYLLEDLVNETLNALLPKGNLRDFNLDLLDGSVVSVDEITTIASTYPMGTARRVVVVRNPAFLSSGEVAQTPAEWVQLAAEASEAGDPSRALTYFFRALGMEPASFESSEVCSRMASLRERLADTSPELLPFLDAAPTTLAHVSPSSSRGDDAERFREWMERRIPPTTILILVFWGTPSLQTSLVRSLRERGVLADVDSLKETTGRDPVTLFINKQLKSAHRQMDEEALRLFRERTGNDLRRIVDELEKVIAYVGENETITSEDVRAAVSNASEATIFDLTDAVGNRQVAKAFSCLQNLLRRGEPPIKVLAMVVRQIRLMLQARLLQEEGHLMTFTPNMPYRLFVGTVYGKWSPEVVALLPENSSWNLLKQKPYALYLTLKQAANYSKEELLRSYDLLLKADEELKSSASSEEEILYRTLEEVIAGSSPKGQKGGDSWDISSSSLWR